MLIGSVVVLLMGVIVTVAVLAALLTGRPFAVFFSDPAAILEFHPMYGVASHVGVLTWWAAAVVCGFTAAALWLRHGAKAQARFFALAGGFTAWLALDDLFLVHEFMAPVYLGIRQEVVFAVYALVTVGLAFKYRTFFLTRHVRLLMLALASLALSVAVDISSIQLGEWRVVAEDVPKLLGAALWFVYFSDAALDALARGTPANATGAEETPFNR